VIAVGTQVAVTFVLVGPIHVVKVTVVTVGGSVVTTGVTVVDRLAEEPTDVVVSVGLDTQVAMACAEARRQGALKI